MEKGRRKRIGMENGREEKWRMEEGRGEEWRRRRREMEKGRREEERNGGTFNDIIIGRTFFINNEEMEGEGISLGRINGSFSKFVEMFDHEALAGRVADDGKVTKQDKVSRLKLILLRSHTSILDIFNSRFIDILKSLASFPTSSCNFNRCKFSFCK